jgi:predicted phosphodiesterase
MSDLHLDMTSQPPPDLAEGVQVVVVAGDTCEGLVKAVDRLRSAYPSPVQIVMTAGNHEFYGYTYPEELAAGRKRAAELDVCFLENNTAHVGSLRIIGATLWTDYLLFGVHLRDAAMYTARDTMRDHKKIKWKKTPWMRFRPQEASQLHLRSVEYFERELAIQHRGPTMLLSHHGMLPEMVDPASAQSMVSAAFTSDLSELLAQFKPNFAVSGHTHYPVNFRRGHTHYISNPRGYPEERIAFDRALVIEVPDTR